MHTLASFMLYTLAMVGIILIGFVVAKFSINTGYLNARKNNFLEVESFLALEPRKNIYVLKAGTERFLISSDINGSRLITKLEKDNYPVLEETYSQTNLMPENFMKKLDEIPFIKSFIKFFMAPTILKNQRNSNPNGGDK